MDKKLRESTNLSLEIMNSKRQVMGKLGHVVHIRVCRLTFDVNVILLLSNNTPVTLKEIFFFNMALARAKTFARPKESPPLQANRRVKITHSWRPRFS